MKTVALRTLDGSLPAFVLHLKDNDTLFPAIPPREMNFPNVLHNVVMSDIRISVPENGLVETMNLNQCVCAAQQPVWGACGPRGSCASVRSILRFQEHCTANQVEITAHAPSAHCPCFTTTSTHQVLVFS